MAFEDGVFNPFSRVCFGFVSRVDFIEIKAIIKYIFEIYFYNKINSK